MHQCIQVGELIQVDGFEQARRRGAEGVIGHEEGERSRKDEVLQVWTYMARNWF